MPIDVGLEVARHIAGEAGWSTGMILVTWSMMCRLASPQFTHGLTGDAAVLHVLGAYNGYEPNCDPRATLLAEYVVARDVTGLRDIALRNGIELEAGLFYAMGQAVDVGPRGWRDGDVVAYDPDVPGQAIHLFAAWPKKRGQLTKSPGRIPEGT